MKLDTKAVRYIEVNCSYFICVFYRSFLEDVNEEVPGQNFIERYTKLLRRLAAEEDLKKLNANSER